MRGSLLVVGLFFFKQKTAYELRISDWSSDVCSSDLLRRDVPVPAAGPSWSAAFLLRDGGVLCRRSVRGLRKQRRPGNRRSRAVGHVGPTYAGRGYLPDMLLFMRAASGRAGGIERPCADNVSQVEALHDRKSVGEGKG